MTWGAGAIAGGQILGGLWSAEQARKSQAEANRLNAILAMLGLGEQRYQFDIRTGELSESRRQREDEINRMLQERFDIQASGLDPFAETGRQAATQRAALLGLSGPEAQQQALNIMTESPGQAFLRERQERALLRNAAALGGLGGGNIRRALQEQAFARAQTDLDRQLERLGGVAAAGQQAAVSQMGGPGYVLTGQDIGVRQGGVRPSPALNIPEAGNRGLLGLGLGGVL